LADIRIGLSAATLILLGAGCGSPYLGKPIEPVDNALALAEVLEKEREGVTSLKADLTLRVKGRIEGRRCSHRVKGDTALFTSDKARARFTKALGLVKALDVAVTPDNVTIYLPWSEKAYTGDVCTYLREKARVPRGFKLDPLSLFMPLLRASPLLVEKGGKYYSVECDMGNGFLYRYQHYVYSGLMARKELLRNGEILLYFSYERYAEIDGKAVPTLVRFGAPKGNFRGWMRAGGVEFNPRIKSRAFTIRLPPGTETIEVEKSEEEQAECAGES
jgi:hypothetical protein